MAQHSAGLMVDQMVGKRVARLAGLTAVCWVDWKAGQTVDHLVD